MTGVEEITLPTSCAWALPNWQTKPKAASVKSLLIEYLVIANPWN
jgi:hypothetical protein